MIGTSTLCKKSISELKNHHFFIPDYQRGYRWEQQDVTNLLNDLWQFSQNQGGQSFYCLQPVVVRRRVPDAQSPAAWEVIDGQQRLTTVHIILTTLGVTVPYTIEYQTRPDSAAFLSSMQQDRADMNIDFYHMFAARSAVAQWRDEHKHTPEACASITRMLQAADEPNAKIIWYEVDAQENAIAVFTRLNMGRIPLTDAELVKALFLRDSNFHNKMGALEQQRIAQQWDEMERVLQADDFWFFLSNTRHEANRIELILDLVARQWNNGGASTHDAHFTFLSFVQALEPGAEPSDDSRALQEASRADVRRKQAHRREACWQAVWACFLTMQEWYRDRTIFHLVGFMVAISSPSHKQEKPAQRQSLVSELWAAYQNSPSRTAFHALLRERTGFRLNGECLMVGRHKVEELSYRGTRTDVVKTLLFFNIATLLNNRSANTRFQFDLYNINYWDVEHISPMAESDSNSRLHDSERMLHNSQKWLEYACRFLSPTQLGETDLYNQAQALKDQDSVDPAAFAALVRAVTAHYTAGEDDDNKDTLGNLTLLDRHTNRSYGDSIFPIKRSRILDLDAINTFVPPCTSNVFLKYYSPDTDDMMYWRKIDRDAYQGAIIETIKKFLKKNC